MTRGEGLTQAEINTLVTWVADGAAGDAKGRPQAKGKRSRGGRSLLFSEILDEVVHDRIELLIGGAGASSGHLVHDVIPLVLR